VKKSLLLVRGTVAAVAAAMVICWSTGAAAKPASHPQLDEQEMYIPCSQCHREATPEVYSQWYNSAHGIAMVKCYQCHGTFETFRLTPDRSSCASCHEKMLRKCPADKACWQCHRPHTFKRK